MIFLVSFFVLVFKLILEVNIFGDIIVMRVFLCFVEFWEERVIKLVLGEDLLESECQFRVVFLVLLILVRELELEFLVFVIRLVICIFLVFLRIFVDIRVVAVFFVKSFFFCISIIWFWYILFFFQRRRDIVFFYFYR